MLPSPSQVQSQQVNVLVTAFKLPSQTHLHPTLTTSMQVQSQQFNVLVTTYEYIMRDRAKLCRLEWKYIIIDEAQVCVCVCMFLVCEHVGAHTCTYACMPVFLY